MSSNLDAYGLRGSDLSHVTMEDLVFMRHSNLQLRQQAVLFLWNFSRGDVSGVTQLTDCDVSGG